MVKGPRFVPVLVGLGVTTLLVVSLDVRDLGDSVLASNASSVADMSGAAEVVVGRWYFHPCFLIGLLIIALPVGILHEISFAPVNKMLEDQSKGTSWYLRAKRHSGGESSLQLMSRNTCCNWTNACKSAPSKVVRRFDVRHSPLRAMRAKLYLVSNKHEYCIDPNCRIPWCTPKREEDALCPLER